MHNLITTPISIKLLAELEEYFKKRNEARKQGPLVHCDDSVATKFFQECKSMKVLKERILLQDEQNIQEKKDEK